MTAIYSAYLALMSITAFILYGMDKSKAKRKKWRIKENTLIATGFFGGSVGALLAMKLFRHKTKHKYFWTLNYMGLIWQTALLVYLLVKR